MMDPAALLHAAEFATAHHGDQRYGTDPYMVHPLSVAHLVAVMGGTVHQVQAAILHDVVEDTTCTLDDVERVFGSEVAAIVAAVTKLPGQTAEDYLDGIRGPAVLVKWCDSSCNMGALDPDVLGPEKCARLSTKYARNLEVLGARLQDPEPYRCTLGDPDSWCPVHGSFGCPPPGPVPPPVVPLETDYAVDPRWQIVEPDVFVCRRGLRWSWRTIAPYGSVYLEQSGTTWLRRRAVDAARSAAGSLQAPRADLRHQDRTTRP